MSIKKRIRDAINQLKENPRPSGVVKLKGEERLFRVCVGDYRVVYEIDDADKKLCVTVNLQGYFILTSQRINSLSYTLSPFKRT